MTYGNFFNDFSLAYFNEIWIFLRLSLLMGINKGIIKALQMILTSLLTHNVISFSTLATESDLKYFRCFCYLLKCWTFLHQQKAASDDDEPATTSSVSLLVLQTKHRERAKRLEMNRRLFTGSSHDQLQRITNKKAELNAISWCFVVEIVLVSGAFIGFWRRPRRKLNNAVEEGKW